MRYGFEMIWANTEAIPAEMVEGESLGDWPDEQFVSESMDEHVALAIPKGAISLLGGYCFPEPAAISFMNIAPEALNRGVRIDAVRDQTYERIAVDFPALIVLSTPTPPSDKTCTIWNATLVSHRKVTSFVAVQPEVSRLAAAYILP